MFLADWSGRRVAAYAITWLVGFPVVMTAFVILGAMASTGSGGFTLGTPSAALPMSPEDAARRDSVVREMKRRTDSLNAAGAWSPDSARAIGYLQGQPSDVMVGLVVSEDDGSDLDLSYFLPWLLPPALLVAAWAWTRRSRPEPD